MKVGQILNNNVAIVKKGSSEIIVYSKGIAFKKKVGQTITEAEIEKTYVLDSNDMLEHFSYLLAHADEKIISLVDEIVAYSESKLNQKANDYLRLTLLDHINFTLQRAKKGQFIRSPLMWEVKKFYPQHFEIGLQALRLMSDMLKVDFPEYEAVSIALHFVNMQETQDNYDTTIQTMETLRDIVSIIHYHFGVKIDESSLNYMRLITHLQYFIQRVIKQEVYDDNDVALNAQISKLYTRAYGCVQKIKVYIKERYQCDVTIDEETYLMLHVHRVTNRNEGTE